MTYDRKGSIEYLVANCSCWKQPGDAAILNGLTDDKLEQLKAAAEDREKAAVVANAAAVGFSDGSNAYRVNPETGAWEKKVVANAPAPKKGAMDDPEDMTDGGADEDMENPDGTMKKKPAANRAKSDEQLLNALPAHLRESVRIARDVEQREKDRVINQILVNSGVSEVDKRSHFDLLQHKTLDDLNYTLSLIPKPSILDDITPARPAARNRRSAQREDDDVLNLPTMNWEPVGEKNGTTKKAEVVDNYDEPVDDEWLATAPPRVRAAVQNAQAIEAREKRKLIEELTANVDDDAQQTRMANRLTNMTLAELKELMPLASKRETVAVRPSYFGAAAAPLSNRLSDPNEDLLPLPSYDWSERRKA